MLDAGKSSRVQIARELGISTAKVARCFTILRLMFRMRIEFRTMVVMDEKTGRRGRGRMGAMVVSDWGILPRRQTLEVCRKLASEFGKTERDAD